MRLCRFFSLRLILLSASIFGLRSSRGGRIVFIRSVPMSLLFLMMQGCGPGPKPPFAEVIKAFTGETPPTKTSVVTSVPPIGATRFFVDCSSGMRGFITPQPSGQPSNYIRVLAEMAKRPGYESTWHCAGIQSPNPSLAASALLQPGVYHTPQHSFGALLKTMEQPETAIDKPSIDVFVSDLAGSEDIDAAGALTTGLDKLVGTKRQLMLWGFRSSYLGEYTGVSIACRGKKTTVKQGQTLPGLGRPFYLLISAPDAKSLEDWNESFSEVLLPAEEFVLAKPPVKLGDLDTPVKGKPDPDNPGHIQEKWLPDGVQPVAALGKDSLSTFPLRRYSVFTFDGSMAATIDFRWKADFDIPLGTGDFKVLKTEIKVWRPKETEDVVAADDHDLTVVLSEDAKRGGRLSYTAAFPAQGSSWRVYQIALNAGSNAAPKWMSEWSATDDCDKASGNRTVDLKAFGNSLSSAFWQKRPFFEHYIAVRRK